MNFPDSYAFGHRTGDGPGFVPVTLAAVCGRKPAHGLGRGQRPDDGRGGGAPSTAAGPAGLVSPPTAPVLSCGPGPGDQAVALPQRGLGNGGLPGRRPATAIVSEPLFTVNDPIHEKLARKSAVRPNDRTVLFTLSQMIFATMHLISID